MIYMSTVILRKSEVISRTGLPNSSLYRLMQEGKFPRPISLSTRSVGWVDSDVDDWIQKKIVESKHKKGGSEANLDAQLEKNSLNNVED